jgi:hypothetical protein
MLVTDPGSNIFSKKLIQSGIAHETIRKGALSMTSEGIVLNAFNSTTGVKGE